MIHHHITSYSLQFLLIYSCFSTLTTSIDTITANQSVHDPSYLLSSAGKFRLVFFSPPNNRNRYVGVMYNLPVMTVIWVANREKPLNDSTGSLQISEDRNLVILDGRKGVFWSTNVTDSSVNTSALLLDTGDLVLRDSSNDTHIWESFRHASDSIVESMRVFTDLDTNERNALTSWRSASDPAPGRFTGSKKQRKAIIVAALVLGFTTIAVSTFFLYKFLLKYKARKQKIEATQTRKYTRYSEESNLQHIQELFLYKFQMISKATENFSFINKLGQGGFGPVYKGKLRNGQEIAVKILARSSNQGLEEFMNVVEVISRLQHRNLVRLLGCCVECEEKMLVYEYMPNGSLDSYLFDSHERGVLDWKTRVMIIEGICRGLLYLHRDSRLRIIHRDLKASNILLDEDLNPKISDLGMARIFCGNDDEANTKRVVGTYGYMSPKYALHGIFSENQIFIVSGVLLLETLSGRRNSRFYDEDHQLFLIAYVWKLWNDGKIIDLMDPSIYDPKMESDIIRYANIGLLCVQEIAAERPNVTTVLLMLNCKIVQLPSPKQPAFVGITRYLKSGNFPKNSLTKYSVNTATVSMVEGR